MEDLLPLIIGILWLLYTFYSKGKKKKSQQRTPAGSKPKKKPTFIEQLLAADGIQVNTPIFAEEEEEPFYETYEEPEPVPAKTGKGKSSPFLNAELAGFRQEGQSQFEGSFFEEEKDGLSGDFSSSDLKEMMQDFDLKKAVVFSTVLSAPYIDYK